MLQYMKINNPKENLIVITSDYKIDGMYFFLKEFYPLLLEAIFYGQGIEIITLNPASGALCYDFDSYNEIKFNRDNLFVNIIENPTLDVFTQIGASSEFELGTLAVVATDESSMKQRAEIIYKYFHEDIEKATETLSYTFCYCEPDGYIIYLVNTSLSDNTIVGIAVKAETYMKR